MDWIPGLRELRVRYEIVLLPELASTWVVNCLQIVLTKLGNKTLNSLGCCRKEVLVLSDRVLRSVVFMRVCKSFTEVSCMTYNLEILLLVSLPKHSQHYDSLVTGGRESS